MPSLEMPAPVRMHRVAIATPAKALRGVLVTLAARGAVELAGELPPAEGEFTDALRRLDAAGVGAGPGPGAGPAVGAGTHAAPVISAQLPDVHALEEQRARDLLAGEAELDRRARMAITQKDVAVLVGWAPDQQLGALRDSLGGQGAAVVDLPTPASEIPPTLLRPTRLAAPFHLLVNTYGVLPYSDVDPTAFAAFAFVVMFGMMFGDAGHGLLLILLSLLLARQRHGPLARVRASWPLVAAAGVFATIFGLLYGEFFGPTGLVPTLWLAPLARPLVLLAAAIVVGSSLLAVSYLLGAANRWREGGAAMALYAEGGLAGGLVFAGIATAAAGWIRGVPFAKGAGVGIALLGLLLVFIGTLVQAGRGAGGVTRGVVEVVDVVVRIGSNIVSFTRLAAFGMTHAALSLVTLQGAQHLAHGVIGWVAAALLFLVGTALALALEGMVATIQALRLEYYELFSRIFEEEGRPFTPFSLPVRPMEDTP